MIWGAYEEFAEATIEVPLQDGEETKLRMLAEADNLSGDEVRVIMNFGAKQEKGSDEPK